MILEIGLVDIHVILAKIRLTDLIETAEYTTKESSKFYGSIPPKYNGCLFKQGLIPHLVLSICYSLTLFSDYETIFLGNLYLPYSSN